MRVQFSGGFFSKPEEIKPKQSHPQTSQATHSKPDTFQHSTKPVALHPKPVEPKKPDPEPKVELSNPNAQFETDSDDDSDYGSDSD